MKNVMGNFASQGVQIRNLNKKHSIRNSILQNYITSINFISCSRKNRKKYIFKYKIYFMSKKNILSRLKNMSQFKIILLIPAQ